MIDCHSGGDTMNNFTPVQSRAVKRPRALRRSALWCSFSHRPKLDHFSKITGKSACAWLGPSALPVFHAFKGIRSEEICLQKCGKLPALSLDESGTGRFENEHEATTSRTLRGKYHPARHPDSATDRLNIVSLASRREPHFHYLDCVTAPLPS